MTWKKSWNFQFFLLLPVPVFGSEAELVLYWHILCHHTSKGEKNSKFDSWITVFPQIHWRPRLHIALCRLIWKPTYLAVPLTVNVICLTWSIFALKLKNYQHINVSNILNYLLNASQTCQNDSFISFWKIIVCILSIEPNGSKFIIQSSDQSDIINPRRYSVEILTATLLMQTQFCFSQFKDLKQIFFSLKQSPWKHKM